MKTPLIFFFICLALGCVKEYEIPEPVIIPGEDFSGHPKNEIYSTSLHQIRIESNAPGMILLIKRNGEDLWIGSDGEANLEYHTPMQVNTPFRTASLTKTFTAVIILKLAEEGRLSLADHLQTFLPELKGQIPASERISIRHLLAHQSGIFDPSNQSTRFQLDLINDPGHMEAMSIPQLLEEYVFGRSLLFEPGTSYSYGNVNYWLLGMIIEKLEEKSLSQVMNERIIEPLDLHHTEFNRNPGPELSREYADLTRSGSIMDVTWYDAAESRDRASSGLISTVHDLYLFMQHLVEGKLISSSSLQDLIRIQLNDCQDPDCEYGLGVTIWRTAAGDAWGNNGSLLGVESNMLYFPEKGDFLVMFRNNGNGSKKDRLWDLLNQ